MWENLRNQNKHWCEKARKHVCLTDRHMTLAVKAALNFNTTNQLIRLTRCDETLFMFSSGVREEGRAYLSDESRWFQDMYLMTSIREGKSESHGYLQYLHVYKQKQTAGDTRRDFIKT